MDITLNRNIGYDELNLFLGTCFSDVNFILIYDGVNDWEDVSGESTIFHYEAPEGTEPFRYGMSIHTSGVDILAVIESISVEISNHFYCSAVCDASRVVLKKENFYYSLLFENERVYLVDDCIFEESGKVIKVVELKYVRPNIQINS